MILRATAKTTHRNRRQSRVLHVARRRGPGAEIADSDDRWCEDSTPSVPQECRGEAEAPPQKLLQDADRLGEQGEGAKAVGRRVVEGIKTAGRLQSQAEHRPIAE